MKTIGMIGGMSWESTATYYRLLNEGVKQALGGLHSAQLLLYSFDFDEIEQMQRRGEWERSGERLAQVAQRLEQAGADVLMICTNTMHKVADQVESAISVPLLHIADATARQLQADGIRKVGLLGTGFTMEQAFYRDRITERFGIEVIVPDKAERDLVHGVIYNELCLGVIDDDSRVAFVRIIKTLQASGAEAVILGCTEIALLVKPEHTSATLYDTTALHAQAAVNAALNTTEPTGGN